MSSTENADPAPSERVYYRSKQDGQRGYLVKRDGEDRIRLDRPMEEILFKVSSLWEPDNQTYPMTEHQIARVAFVADRALCGAMGKHDLGRQDWLSLKEQARIKWMKDGPESGDIRDDLFDAIIGTLRGLTNGIKG